MNYKIIADSCCDLTEGMKKEMGVVSIPLTMTLGNKDFCDDEHLDLNGFLSEMKTFTGKPHSSAPSPFLYQEAIETAGDSFIVTLSNKLSASYSNAVLGKSTAIENSNSRAHIFDSKSAVAGETLIVIKLHELIKNGISKEKIIETTNSFIDNMKTYFVLENYDNLQKNGRLSKITGSLISFLNIKLIMGADGNGEIALFEKCRSAKHMIEQLISYIDKSGKETQDENLVISHCNNHPLAEHISALILKRFQFKKIYIVPTGGLSSMYADDKGIIMAF